MSSMEPPSAPTLLMTLFAMLETRRGRWKWMEEEGRGYGASSQNFDTHLRRGFHGGTRASLFGCA